MREILAILTFLLAFLNQTAIKRNNPRKFLRMGDGETVEFDKSGRREGSGAVVGEPAKPGRVPWRFPLLCPGSTGLGPGPCSRAELVVLKALAASRVS